MSELERIKEKLAEFALERDWDKFHSPKNLAMSLAIEAAELMEIFQWMKDEDSFSLSDRKLEEAGYEIADVLIYLVRLCDKLGIDPVLYAEKKIEINREKYPMDLVKGSSKKYSEY